MKAKTRATPRKRGGLLHHFKHSILPMKGNNHHPHVLKREVVFCVLSFVLILEVAVLVQGLLLFRSPNFLASVLPAVVADLTNTQRTDNNLQPLAVSPLLTKAAQEKADDMAAKGYFSHVSPDGTLPWHWFTTVGYTYKYAGENLAVNFDDSNNVVNAWMASPMHRANILKQDYTEEGIGMATGMYEGHSTIFVVQFFAQPEGAVSSDVNAAPSAPTANPVTVAVADVRKVLQPTPSPTELMTTSADQSSPIATNAASQDKSQPSVLGLETPTAARAVSVTALTQTKQPSFFQKLLASPFSTTGLIFVIIAAFFISVLIAGLVYRKRLPRMTATISGLAVVVIVLGFAILNHHFLSSGMHVDAVTSTAVHEGTVKPV